MSHLPDVLRLEPLSSHRYSVANVGEPDAVVFGGQLLAQMIMAASVDSPHKTVKTINVILARAAKVDAETEVDVQTFHAGRSFASHTITAWQGDRLCARASVLTHSAEDDLITHQLDMSPATPPDTATPARDHSVFPGAEYVIAHGVDLTDSAAPTGPAELTVWYRWPDAPGDPDLPADASNTQAVINQAALAWGTDGFLIGTAMRPHAGIAYDRAHVDIATGVVSHTLTFHRPFVMTDWVVMTHESPFAGGGRSYGRCDIHDRAGTLIASYVQDSMIRAMGSR